MDLLQCKVSISSEKIEIEVLQADTSYIQRETVVYKDICVQLMQRLCQKCDVCVQILLYAPESGLIPLAQDYARVSRDTNYLPITIKRAKRDRSKRTYRVCTQLSC